MVNSSTRKLRASSKNSKPLTRLYAVPPAVELEIPHSPESEKAVLGSLLFDPALTPHVVTRLRPSHFLSSSNKQIFQALTSLHARGLTPDISLLRQELQDNGALEQVGGLAYLGGLTDASTTRDIESHLVRVCDAAARRKTYVRCVELMENLSTSSFTIDQAAADIESLREEIKGIVSRSSDGEELSINGTVFRRTREKGVQALDTDTGQWIFVCSYLVPEAYTRDAENDNWGLLLRFLDADGVEHSWAMPLDLLDGDGRECRKELLRMGLRIGPKKARNFLEIYLHMQPGKKARCVERTGWYADAYVFPDETFGGAENEPVYWQSPSIRQSLLATRGSLAGWRDEIGKYCSENTRLIFAASAAFAAALLAPVDGEGGGFHFRGSSSKGKTTILKVAGSVWGGGSKGYIRRWKATANGLESVASLHNDALLCLDELSEIDPRDAGDVVYMLANGQGKLRQSKNRASDLRSTLQWRTQILSCGEVSLADHMALAGKMIRGGQEVRMVDIEAATSDETGAFECHHDFSNTRALSEHLQQAAQRNYGTPIRQFLKRLVVERDRIVTESKEYIDLFQKKYDSGDGGSEVGRVANRFALVAFAGELATRYGITGWNRGESHDAAVLLFRTWLSQRTSQGTEEDRIVAQVRGFLEKHGSNRFQSLEERHYPNTKIVASNIVTSRAGFIKRNADGDFFHYYILPVVFKQEVCQGLSETQVLRVLEQRGYQEKDNKGRYGHQIRTNEGRVRCYRISTKIHAD